MKNSNSGEKTLSCCEDVREKWQGKDKVEEGEIKIRKTKGDAKWRKKVEKKKREENSKQEGRTRWKKAPCQALETVIHGDHLS